MPSKRQNGGNREQRRSSELADDVGAILQHALQRAESAAIAKFVLHLRDSAKLLSGRVARFGCGQAPPHETLRQRSEVCCYLLLELAVEMATSQ